MAGASGHRGSFFSRRAPFAVCLAVSLLALCAQSVQCAEGERRSEPVPPGFDAYVRKISSDWSVPGIAVAVVEGDRLSFAKAYGLRERNHPAQLTVDSMFGIASITKALVAGGVAKLVDEKKLGWDDRVVDHLPWFRVADPYVTRHLTIRDLLTHRSGIASYGDILEEIPHLTERAAVERLAHADQAFSFRERYQYSTYAFMILTEIMRAVSGKPWGEYLSESLWKPLGMTSTYAHADEFVRPGNIVPTGDGWLSSVRLGQAAVRDGVDVASSHIYLPTYLDPAFVDDKRELDFVIAHFHRTAIDPGQGAFASLRDLSRWARVLLNDGTSEGTTVLSRETVRDLKGLHGIGSRRTRAWPISWKEESQAPAIRHVGTGLGLFIEDYRGHVLYGHSGGELGYASQVIIDQEQGFAIVVLVNHGSTDGVIPALLHTILDWRYGFEPRDWSAQFIGEAKAAHEERFQAIQAFNAQYPRADTANLDPLRYVGQYENPLVGTITIELRKGALTATTGESYVVEMSYRGDQTFLGLSTGPGSPGVLMEFAADAQDGGRASRFLLSHSSFPRPLEFVRIAPASR